jgi:hypothetical protein
MDAAVTGRGFIHVGNCAYWASLLDNNRCGSSRQHGWLLQKSQHYGRLLAVVHYWCGKIFDRCIVQYRRAITCVLLGRRCNVTSRKVGSVYGQPVAPCSMSRAFAPGSKSIYESDFIRLDDRDAIPQSRGKSWRPPGAAEHASGAANRIRKKKPATIGDVGQRLWRFRSESHTA